MYINFAVLLIEYDLINLKYIEEQAASGRLAKARITGPPPVWKSREVGRKKKKEEREAYF